MASSPEFDADSAWGTYAPNLLNRLILSASRSLPAGSNAAYRFGRSLRSAIRRQDTQCFDVDFEGLSVRLMNRGNYCELRALVLPQFYDAEERDWLCEAMPDGGVFVDVGANVGLFSLTVAARLGSRARIFAVEPDPQMAERLMFSVNGNGIDLELARTALSDYSGEGSLQLSLSQRGKNTLNATGSDAADSTTTQVGVTTLYSLIQSWGLDAIDALKIDIEGHEGRVLGHFFDNAPDTLWPKAIVIEYEHDAQAIIDRLTGELGYHTQSRTRRNLLLTR